MITNFDLMWIHVKKLIDDMTASHESMRDERLYEQYCNAFEQLAEIIDSMPEEIAPEKIQDVLHAVKQLEIKLTEEQKYLQDTIASERLKARTHAAYSHSPLPSGLYNRKT